MRTPVCSNPSQTSPSINQSQPGTRFSPEPDTFNMFVSTLYFYHLTPHYHNHPDVSVMAHGWAGVCLQTTVEWEYKCFSCSHISLKAICSLRIKNVFSLRLQCGDHHHWSLIIMTWCLDHLSSDHHHQCVSSSCVIINIFHIFRSELFIWSHQSLSDFSSPHHSSSSSTSVLSSFTLTSPSSDISLMFKIWWMVALASKVFRIQTCVEC